MASGCWLRKAYLSGIVVEGGLVGFGGAYADGIGGGLSLIEALGSVRAEAWFR